MRKPASVSGRRISSCARSSRPGVTTAEIDAVITEHFRQCGAEPLFKDYPHQNSGRPAFPAATCTSVNEEVVHGIPTHRSLREGDIVSVDTGCRLNGWCGDAAVTYPAGRIAPACPATARRHGGDARFGV